jgi:hypothetical protein
MINLCIWPIIDNPKMIVNIYNKLEINYLQLL